MKNYSCLLYIVVASVYATFAAASYIKGDETTTIVSHFFVSLAYIQLALADVGKD